MAVGKKSFILYTDLLHTFEGLDDQEAGKLIKHLLRYVNDMNPEAPDKLIKIAFEPIKQMLKRDLKKWDYIREVRSLAGKASADKRKQNQQVLTSVDTSQQSSTNPTVSVSGIVSVNEEYLYIIFEEFRKAYQGTKRGQSEELKNLKKHKDWKEVIPELLPNYQKQQQALTEKRNKNEFVPPPKNLKTYINQRCWTEVIGSDEPEIKRKPVNKIDLSKLSYAELHTLDPKDQFNL